MSRPFNQIQPDQAVAVCSRAQAEQLVGYDQHVVRVNGRAGVLLTSPWMPVEEHSGPFLLTVVFHSTANRPSAPGQVQAVVDELQFQFRGQPR